uniref:Uncharacterized protein n=1 Tax=Anguilla anguilla TaxID=7936 RepID=A0A0E9WV99_ANGAN
MLKIKWCVVQTHVKLTKGREPEPSRKGWRLFSCEYFRPKEAIPLHQLHLSLQNLILSIITSSCSLSPLFLPFPLSCFPSSCSCALPLTLFRPSDIARHPPSR